MKIILHIHSLIGHSTKRYCWARSYLKSGAWSSTIQWPGHWSASTHRHMVRSTSWSGYISRSTR